MRPFSSNTVSQTINNAKTVDTISSLHVCSDFSLNTTTTQSNFDRLELFSPTHGQRSQQQSGPIVLINKPKFLKAERLAEIRKNVIPRSMAVEALSW